MKLGFSSAAVATLLLFGCGRAGSSSSDPDPHVALLTKLYADHLNANQGRIPSDEGAFKAFIRNHGAGRLTSVDPAQIDSLFVSTRDNQPLVVVYKPPADPRQPASVVVYEQSAVDGKRSVGYRSGTAELIDEAAIAELAPTAAAKR